MHIQLTPQIHLRQLQLSDSLEIFNTINTQREHLGKWLPFVQSTQQPSDTQKFVESTVNAPEESFEYTFTIWKNSEFVGLIGFRDTDNANKKTEIGYWLSEKYLKQGIITKSVEKLCDFAFNDLDINRIQIKCAVGNTTSSNIPKRLGFSFEGIEREGELFARNIFADLEVYSKLKKDQ